MHLVCGGGTRDIDGERLLTEWIRTTAALMDEKMAVQLVPCLGGIFAWLHMAS